ncbi:MAG: hypothetical protein K8S27_03795 [Candidatus Omnitrophica bacterium]|nr:hypothetical protein [Candidatus Omnitrophota bacterium]
MTRDEIEAGLRYRTAFDNGDNVEKRDAWRQLASSLGTRRAAYVSRTMLRDRNSTPEEKTVNWRKPPKLKGLPDHFEVFAYRGSELVHHVQVIPPGGRISDNLSILAPPDVLQDGLFDDDSQWVVDFTAAETAGMAVKILMSDDDLRQGFSRLVVVGLRSGSPEEGKALLEELLDGHRFTDGFGFVPYDTPTNNTPEARSGYLATESHSESSFETEVQGSPLWHLPAYVDRYPTKYPTNAQTWGAALGLGVKNEVLRYVENSGDYTDAYASHLQAVLSPVLIRYLFDHMLPGVLEPGDAGRVATEFSYLVRARGPLPTIRIGNQPYGVLPVSSIGRKSAQRPFGWESSASLGGSAKMADKLQHVLTRLFERWSKWARIKELVPRVTRDGDPDEELLQILSMQPTSIAYQARPFIGEDFISWLLIVSQGRLYPDALSADANLPTGEDVSAVSVLMDWYRQWKNKQEDAAAILHNIGGTSSSEDSYSDKPLFRLSGWREGTADPIPTTVGSDPDDVPENYLPAVLAEALSGGPAVTSQTLLYDMIRRSQKLDNRTNTHLRTLLGSPIDELDTVTALDFFNSATTPEQIVERIRDDPDYGLGPPRAYGVRLSLAKRILDIRNRLPGGKFITLDQIDEIRGVGDDTWHDILYSFPEIPQTSGLRELYRPDYDSLFRQALDLCTHRLDAWLTACAYRRLRAMRGGAPEGIYFGAYCWVEDLVPSPNISIHRGLDFFNRAHHKEHIVERVWDYRNHASGSKSQLDGLKKLAKEIIELRDSLSEKQIKSQDQLNTIKNRYQVEWQELLLSFDRLSEGYIHAPSTGHAATAAVLHNAFLTHKNSNASGQDGNSCCVNLHSDRVRRALRILEGIRQGQNLGALLGFQFERWLPNHLRRYIDDFRKAFPTVSQRGSAESSIPVETVSARNVVDGAALARRWQQLCDAHTGPSNSRPSVNTAFVDDDPIATEHDADLAVELDGVLDSLDAVGDVLLTEGVYHTVQGNYERGGAALEAASGNAPPPEIRSMETPISGTNLGHRVCMLFPEEFDTAVDPQSFGPRGLAEPRIATWFSELLGPMEEIGCTTQYDSLEALNQADVNDLVSQVGLSEGTAQRLVNERSANGIFWAFSSISERVPGLSGSDIDAIKQLITEETVTLSLADLGASDSAKRIDAADLLYLAFSPPAGEETEIEQRIAEYVRGLQGLPENVRVIIQAQEMATFPRSLNDAFHVAHQALHTLGGHSYCGPDALCPPVLAHEATFSESDVDELEQRISSAHAAASSVLSQFSGGLAADVSNHASVVSALFEANRFGVAGGIPGANPDVDLETLRSNTAAELTRRITSCEQLQARVQAARAASDPQTATAAEVLGLLVDAMRALFGKSFIVLPTFATHESSGFGEAFADQSVLAGLGEERIRLWLQQVAQIHGSLQQLDDLLMLAESWQQTSTNGGSPACSLKVAQLPYRSDVKWLALDDVERGGGPEHEDNIRGTLSMVAALGGTPAQSGNGASPKYAGIIFEHWDELLPSRTVDTSVSFHYNAPNTQAPQCLLLAVPPQDPGSTTAEWSTVELAQIVNDSFDLAKARAVDLDALRQLDDDVDDRPDVGGMLPSILLPTNTDDPGWARDETMDLFNTWLRSTLRRGIVGFESFTYRVSAYVRLEAYSTNALESVVGGMRYTHYFNFAYHSTSIDITFTGPQLIVAGHYREEYTDYFAYPGLVCDGGPLLIELPEPVSLAAVYCGKLNVITEAGAMTAFSDVKAFDDSGAEIPIEVQRIPHDTMEDFLRPKKWFLRRWHPESPGQEHPTYAGEEIEDTNPSVWYFEDPGPGPANGDFEVLFSEFHIYDSKRSGGQKIKRIELPGDSCVMAIEVYDYPKVEE